MISLALAALNSWIKMNFQKETDFAAKIASQQYLRPVADLGGGGVTSLGIRPPADPKGPPFVLF